LTTVDSADPTKTKELEGSRTFYPVLDGSTLATFTINAKVSGKNIDKTVKKAIATDLKDRTYTFAVSQRVVEGYADEDNYYIFAGNDGEGNPLYGASSNNVFNMAQDLFFDTRDEDEIDFDEFNITKFDQNKGKANIGLYVGVGDTKKGYDDALITLKAGTDYDLADGTVGGEKVKYVEFKGNYVYEDTRAVDLTTTYGTINTASLGYKWAFRQTPSDAKKKAKTFRYGYYKADNDGFVYNVED